MTLLHTPLAAPAATLTVLVLCAALLHIPTCNATGDNDQEDEAGGGLLSALRDLIHAVAARLTGLEMTSSSNELQQQQRRVRYRGYQLLRVQLPPRSLKSGALERLQQLLQLQGVQLWSRCNRSADVLLPPSEAAAARDTLDDLEYTVLSADVQKMISFENPLQLHTRQTMDKYRKKGHRFTWERYHRYKDMVGYMRFLAATYPSRARVLILGLSSEGRPLLVLKIFSEEHPTDGLHETPQLRGNETARRRTSQRTKPAVWIDAGTHGREWIGPAVALYLCKQLLERGSRHSSLLDSADWYVMPVLNPDGYEYTHTVDRLWRKTRSSHEEEVGRLFHFLQHPCAGADLNRNWDFHWGEEGTSDDPCSNVYAGPRPFSEPESRAVATFIMARRHRFQVFLTLHSYSQLWLIPPGDTKERPQDYEDLYNKAFIAVEALRRVHGTTYKIGTTSELLYPLSGTALSWAKWVAGIRYSYGIELPDRGAFGFLLPASYIIPTGEETVAAIRALVSAVVCHK